MTLVNITLTRRPAQSRRVVNSELTSAELVRWWSKVRTSAEGCWLWRGKAGDAYGHGIFSIRRDHKARSVYAHRQMWALVVGPIPDGLDVLHRCDVPFCVRPDHLFLGTQADNMADGAAKRRFTVPRHKKLTLTDRLAIYMAPRDRGTGNALARAYGVSKFCISLIRRGRFVGSPLSPVPALDVRQRLLQSIDVQAQSRPETGDSLGLALDRADQRAALMSTRCGVVTNEAHRG